MSTAINWISTNTDTDGVNDSSVLHFAECHAEDEREIQRFINQLIDHCVAILPRSLREDGRYLLFDWDSPAALISVVSTDDHKQVDGCERVQACIARWQNPAPAIASEYSASIQYWIRDYLTTCPEFLHFSLIAVFCEGDRDKARLL